MGLVVYNTLTRRKSPFEPQEPGRVGMYVCGPTVYDMSHIGHARVYVAFDVIYRWLQASGYDVTYVRNYTDVDDKIIARSHQTGMTADELAERFIVEYQRDMDTLGVLKPSVEPRVTGSMDEIVAFVGLLIERGHAYASKGSVYFAVRSFAEYGKLSGRAVDDMRSGSRVDVGDEKRDPLDFALWKAAKPGEPSWDSPWGAGRPGWHIECSAMSAQHLGPTFDIHGGGKDLIFPHHENEIAQSEGAHGVTFARYWLHNGFVTIDEEKMSKSLDNFFTIREVLERYEPEVLRTFLLSTHYRSPISFSDAAIDEIQRKVVYYYETLRKMDGFSAQFDSREGPSAADLFDLDVPGAFREALDNDFNTAKAFAVAAEVFHIGNELCDAAKQPRLGGRKLKAPDRSRLVGELRAQIAVMGKVLGLWGEEPGEYCDRLRGRQAQQVGVDVAEVDRLMAERTAARASKDFARGDELRDELAALGVEVLDFPTGSDWRVK